MRGRLNTFWCTRYREPTTGRHSGWVQYCITCTSGVSTDVVSSQISDDPQISAGMPPQENPHDVLSASCRIATIRQSTQFKMWELWQDWKFWFSEFMESVTGRQWKIYVWLYGIHHVVIMSDIVTEQQYITNKMTGCYLFILLEIYCRTLKQLRADNLVTYSTCSTSTPSPTCQHPAPMVRQVLKMPGNCCTWIVPLDLSWLQICPFWHAR